MSGRRVLTIVAVLLVCLLIVGGAALAAPMLSPGRGQAEPGASVGYQLTTGTWQAYGTLSGPGYRLLGAPEGTGTQCCCVYLPCELRNYHH